MTAVVAIHCGLMPMGWIGVWLFFVISGFVVTTSVINRVEFEPPGDRLAGFLKRRVVRILPVYYLYVLVAIAATSLTGRVDGFAAGSLLGFFNNVAMGAGLGELKGIPTAHLWTISTEMQFYALYGLVLCLMPRRVTIGVLVAFVLLTPVLRLLVSNALASAGWQPERLAYAIYTAPALHFDTFAMGGLLAFLHQRGRLASFGRPIFFTGLAAMAAYCAAYVAVNAHMRGVHGIDLARDVISGVLAGEYREVFLYSAVGLASAGLVALAVLRDSWVSWLLGSPALQWIGVVSYGAYIFHAVAITMALKLVTGGLAEGQLLLDEPLWVRLSTFVLAYALTLVMAWASFEYFEKPVARLALARKARLQPGI